MRGACACARDSSTYTLIPTNYGLQTRFAREKFGRVSRPRSAATAGPRSRRCSVPRFRRSAAHARKYGVDVQWTTFDAFFTLVEREGVALNVASLVGLGTTRACVAGPDARRLTSDELTAQDRLIRGAVEEGALGVSSGLIYEPGRYADLEELVACASAARIAGAPLYASHVRNEGDERRSGDRGSARRRRTRRGRRAVLASQSRGPQELGQGAPHARRDRSCARARRRRRVRRLSVRRVVDRACDGAAAARYARAATKPRSSGCAIRSRRSRQRSRWSSRATPSWAATAGTRS